MRAVAFLLLAFALAACTSLAARPTATPTARPASPTVQAAPQGQPVSNPGAAPAGRDCPSTHPIKGNIGDKERIYHLPGGNSYGATIPERCFTSEADARAAGYRRAMR